MAGRSRSTSRLGDRVTKGDARDRRPGGPAADDLTAAIANRRSAAIQLEIAQEQLDDASGTDAIRQAQIALYKAQSQLAQARDDRSTTSRPRSRAATLVAPIDGDRHRGQHRRRASTPRPATRSSSTPATYEVTTDVVESDISAIKLGQPATVTIAALDADVDGHGHRDRAGRRAQRTSGGVVSYAVTVTLDGRRRPTLRAGHDRRRHDHDGVARRTS